MPHVISPCNRRLWGRLWRHLCALDKNMGQARPHFPSRCRLHHLSAPCPVSMYLCNESYYQPRKLIFLRLATSPVHWHTKPNIQSHFPVGLSKRYSHVFEPTRKMTEYKLSMTKKIWISLVCEVQLPKQRIMANSHQKSFGRQGINRKINRKSMKQEPTLQDNHFCIEHLTNIK